MGLQQVFIAKCDGCGREEVNYETTQARALRHLYRMRWGKRSVSLYCPHCLKVIDQEQAS